MAKDLNKLENQKDITFAALPPSLPTCVQHSGKSFHCEHWGLRQDLVTRQQAGREGEALS